jgi:excisionase family DNA binding protein
MKMYTTAEVAEILREASPWATRRRLHAGEIKGIKVGRQWLVSEDALQAFLTKKTTVPDVRRRRQR